MGEHVTLHHLESLHQGSFGCGGNVCREDESRPWSLDENQNIHGAKHTTVNDNAERGTCRCQDDHHIGREIGVVVPQVTLSAQHYIPCPGRQAPNLNGGHALDVLCLLLESWCPHLLQLSDNLRDGHDRSNLEARGVRRARGQTWQEIEIDEHCVGATGIGREVLDNADCGVPAHHLHGLPCRSRGILGL